MKYSRRVRLSITLLITCTVFILGIFCLLGSTSTSKALSDVYEVQLNLTNINFTMVIPSYRYARVTPSLTLEDAGLSEIYRLGIRSFCKGSSHNGNFKATRCLGLKAPDPATILLNDIKEKDYPPLRGLTYDMISFPYDVPDLSRGNFSINVPAKYYCLLIAIVSCGITMVLLLAGLIYGPLFTSWCWRIFELVLAFISGLCFMIPALVTVGTAFMTRDGFNSSKRYGIEASVGKASFHIMIWLSFGLLLILYAIVTMIKCSISCSKSLSESLGLEEEIHNEGHGDLEASHGLKEINKVQPAALFPSVDKSDKERYVSQFIGDYEKQRGNQGFDDATSKSLSYIESSDLEKASRKASEKAPYNKNPITSEIVGNTRNKG